MRSQARRTQIGWHNLTHDRPRTAVAVAGVAFSLIIIFMQLGFLGSVARSAVTVLEKLEFDLVLVSADYAYLSDPGTVRRPRLEQAAAIEGVGAIVPFYTGTSLFRNPENDEPDARSQLRAILVLGFRPDDRAFRSSGPFDAREVEARRDDLKRPDTLLIDRLSRAEFGPFRPGTAVDLGIRGGRIVGLFTLGCGFAADGAAIVGDQNFGRLFGPGRLDEINLGLVQLESGADLARVAARLVRALPGREVRVLTRQQLLDREVRYWIRDKSIGTLFFLGVVVAFVVGVVVVFQVLSSDITEHFAEYATLKAIGRSPREVSGVVLQQAIILAAAGYVPAFAIAEGLFAITRKVALLPMSMDVATAAVVFLLSNAICVLSALASLQKVHEADPADLF